MADDGRVGALEERGVQEYEVVGVIVARSSSLSAAAVDVEIVSSGVIARSMDAIAS